MGAVTSSAATRSRHARRCLGSHAHHRFSEDKLKSGPKALVGNKGFRKYLKAEKDSVSIDRDKIDQESRYDGKWVLKTNTRLSEEVALKYKELWQVEQVFRDMKSILETRPIYHQTDEAIRGHVFCSFLALLLRKELNSRLEKAELDLEWADVKQDLAALHDITIDEKVNGLLSVASVLAAAGRSSRRSE